MIFSYFLLRVLDKLLARTTAENKAFYKRFLTLAFPVVMAELLSALVNIMDTVMITRGMGIYEVTGAALANQFFFIYVVVFWGAAASCGVFIGQYHGKGDTKNIQKTVGLGLTCSLAIMVFFFVPALFFPQAVIRIYSPDPQVIYLGAQFLRTLAWCFPFVAVTFTRNVCMRNTGQTKIPMVTTSTALILNFLGNLILIFGFNAPLSVVAMGTVFARIVELCLQEYLIRKYKVPVVGTLKQYLTYDRAFVREVFKVGIFIIMATSTWSIGTSVYNIAYGLIGPQAQGAVKISTSLMQLFQVFGTSLGIATQIMMTNALGSGDKQKAVTYAKKCFNTAVGVSLVMGVLLVIFAPWIVGVFGAEGEVRHYVMMLTYLYSVGLVLRTGNFIQYNGILRSGGDTKFHFFADLVAVWCIGIPMAFIGAVWLQWPVYGVVLLVHADEIYKFFLGMWRVKSHKWVKKLV